MKFAPRLGCYVMCLLFLCGCTASQGPEPLPLQSAPPMTMAGEVAPPDRWWTAFRDAPLNGHVARALDENFTLVSAWERVRAGRALARREASELYPQVDGVGSAELSDTITESGRTEERWELGLRVSYEVDLWGRIDSRVEAERLRATATHSDYRAAALSVSTAVAQTWYQLAEARLQLALIGEQVDTNADVLELLRVRFRAGQIRGADVLRQRQLLEATREQLIVLGARADVLRHQLAVLTGQPPQGVEGLDFADASLPALPPMPKTGIASDLVLRRPDVRSALRRLRAADRDVASAVSDQYPRINLSASLVSAAEHPERLFKDWLASIAGQIVAPLIDGGRRRAEVERADAVRRQLLAEYGQAVLVAFREVEDALAQERRQIDRIRSFKQQLELAKQTSDQLRTQYLKGLVEYIDVLTALRAEQQLQRDILTGRRVLLGFRIALYRALAGGFETDREFIAVETIPSEIPAHTE